MSYSVPFETEYSQIMVLHIHNQIIYYFVQVKRHAFFKDVNWDTLARQKVVILILFEFDWFAPYLLISHTWDPTNFLQAMFIPSAEAHDTSYFMSRYIWNVEDDEHCAGGSDFYDHSETSSSGSGSDSLDEDVRIIFNLIFLILSI